MNNISQNITHVPRSANSSLSYNVTENNSSSGSHTWGYVPENHLGNGIGKIIRGAFDYLYYSLQKMWTSEPLAEELMTRRQQILPFPILEHTHAKRALQQAIVWPASFDLSTLSGTNGFTVPGIITNGQLGWSVSTAGDLNGDGMDDLVLGADAGPTSAYPGEAYVLFGQMGGWPSSFALSTLDGTNGFAIPGVAADPDGALGFSVSTAGDLNNDGLDDLVLGAPYGPRSGVNQGAAYVIFGQTSGWTDSFDLTTLNGTNGFGVPNITANSWLGNSVSTAGDFNGDGTDDLVLGAPLTSSQAGAAYVIFGQESGWTASFNLGILDGTNGFAIPGIATDGGLGWSVSTAGDINGDGISDLVLAAEGVSSDAGAVYVLFGQAGGWPASFNLTSLNGTNGFTLPGIVADGQLGYSVSTTGDLNGDGYDDLILGAIGVSSNDGAAYAIFGHASGWPAFFDLATLDGANGFAVPGIAAADFLGASVSGAGDMNGDGIDDLVLGAYGASSDAGAAYLLFGQTGEWPASFNLSTLNGTNGFAIPGIAANDYFGASVSTAGDFNGDGLADLVLGAEGVSTDVGAAYVIFGVGASLATPTVSPTALPIAMPTSSISVPSPKPIPSPAFIPSPAISPSSFPPSPLPIPSPIQNPSPSLTLMPSPVPASIPASNQNPSPSLTLMPSPASAPASIPSPNQNPSPSSTLMPSPASAPASIPSPIQNPSPSLTLMPSPSSVLASIPSLIQKASTSSTLMPSPMFAPIPASTSRGSLPISTLIPSSTLSSNPTSISAFSPNSKTPAITLAPTLPASSPTPLISPSQSALLVNLNGGPSSLTTDQTIGIGVGVGGALLLGGLAGLIVLLRSKKKGFFADDNATNVATAGVELGIYQEEMEAVNQLKDSQIVFHTGTPEEEAIKKEYDNLIQQEPTAGSALFNEARKFPHRNRYFNILPNEPTRFKIENDPSFYFNANWVLEKKAIACQGPKIDELAEFWQMVWEFKAVSIVMLTDLVENTIEKCSAYWPVRDKVLKLNKMSITAVKEDVLFKNGNERIVRRDFKIMKNEKSRDISQFHLVNWPDHGVVSPVTLVGLVRRVKEPFIVHCSAGVSRTGTFLTAYQGFKQKTVPLANILKDLRDPYKGRVGLVQSSSQYLVAYQAVQLLKSLEGLEDHDF